MFQKCQPALCCLQLWNRFEDLIRNRFAQKKERWRRAGVFVTLPAGRTSGRDGGTRFRWWNKLKVGEFYFHLTWGTEIVTVGSNGSKPVFGSSDLHILGKMKNVIHFSKITESTRVLNISGYSYNPFPGSKDTLLLVRRSLLLHLNLFLSLQDPILSVIFSNGFWWERWHKHYSYGISSIKITNTILYQVNSSTYKLLLLLAWKSPLDAKV